MPTRTHEADAGPSDRPRDAGVEHLARRLGEVVEDVPESERQELREYAIELLREESEAARQRETARTAGAPTRPTGVFGFAVLLGVAGGALLFLVPPVGIVLLFFALPLAAWGVLQTALRKAETPPDDGVEKRPDPAAPPAETERPGHGRT